MAGAAKLLRRRHAGRAGADDRDPLAGLLLRRIGADVAGLVSLVGDRLLDRLDGDRNVLEVQRAGFLAGRRADAAGEFREIVGRVEVADRVLPVAIIDEVVPVRDLVVDRAAGRAVAERNAAIHAARGLFLDLLVRHRQRELAEMPDAVGCRLVLVHLPVDLEKTCYLAHSSTLVTSPGTPGAGSTWRRSCDIKRPAVQTGVWPRWRAADYSAATPMRMRAISSSARRYSTGMILRNFGR